MKIYTSNINKRNSNLYTNRNVKKDLNFGDLECIDLGGTGGGAVKVLRTDDYGNPIYFFKGPINETNPLFEDKSDFTRQMSRFLDSESLIDEEIDKTNRNLSLNTLSVTKRDELTDKLNELTTTKKNLISRPKAEREIKGFAMCVPGVVKEDTAVRMGNIRDKHGIGLTKVPLGRIIEIARENPKVDISENIIQLFSKDGALPAVSAIDKVIQIGKTTQNLENKAYEKAYKKIFRQIKGKIDGFIATVCHPGTGWCTSQVKKYGEYLIFEMNEESYQRLHNPITGGASDLRDLGASSGSFIKNFAKDLGIGPDFAETLGRTGQAKMVTQTEFDLNNVKHKKAIQILRNSGFYEVSESIPGTTTLKLLDEHLPQFKKASKCAIDAYAQVVAMNANLRMHEFCQKFILSGPLNHLAVDKTIQNDPVNYGAKNLIELIKKFTKVYTEGKDTPIMMNKLTGFNFILDEALDVPDNTLGLLKLLKMEMASKGSVVINASSIRVLAKDFLKSI